MPFNIVTWSLFYEMTFYFAFPLLAVLATASAALASSWLHVAGIVLPVVAVALGADMLVLCWSLLFFGVALAAAEEFLREKIARVPSLAIVAAYLVVTTRRCSMCLPAVAGILAFGVVALLVIAKSLRPGQRHPPVARPAAVARAGPHELLVLPRALDGRGARRARARART